MNKEWVGDRVSVIDVKKSIENIVLEKDDVGWGPNSVFQFPLKGGTGFIWKQIASYINQDNIRLSTKVKSIDLKQKIITTQTNQKYKYQNLITTIPLTQFCKLSNHPKTDLAINNLSFSTVHIVGIGLEGKVPDHLKTKCWIYFPEDNSPFYRATVFSNYSPNNVPGHGKHWSLMFEVAQSEFKPVNQTTVVDEVIKGALNTKLIGPKNKIISKFHYKAPLGYPTPTLKRDKALKVLLPLLEKSNIYSRGRFGAWKYEVSNQDHTFMQGVEVVDRILKSKKEKTVWDPNYVNSKKR
jgi:protoporphyrinogen oxidase